MPGSRRSCRPRSTQGSDVGTVGTKGAAGSQTRWSPSLLCRERGNTLKAGALWTSPSAVTPGLSQAPHEPHTQSGSVPAETPAAEEVRELHQLPPPQPARPAQPGHSRAAQGPTGRLGVGTPPQLAAAMAPGSLGPFPTSHGGVAMSDRQGSTFTLTGPAQVQSLVGRWEDRAVVTALYLRVCSRPLPFSRATQSKTSRPYQGRPEDLWAAAICELWHGNRQAAKQTWDNLYC